MQNNKDNIALKISALNKTYQGGFEALKNIDLTIAKGDFFALLGPNGAGKSTLINIISSLANPTAGDINIFGLDLKKQSSQAKKYIGLVPQEFNFNVFEPLEEILINQAGYYGIEKSKAKIRAQYCLEKLSLWDRHRSVPRELSGGMKRRLMIARALVHSPKLLILDEPTAGVDIEIRRSMWQFLEQINQDGTTIILTTHYLEEAESLCKNIAIINKGQIAEQGKLSDVLQKLDHESFVIYCQDKIKNNLKLDNFKWSLRDDSSFEVCISLQQTLNDLFSLLSAQNITVTGMRNKTNRLEEIFLNLTKRDL
ncbi:MAG: ABC transporter ATP-binding protein [Gammaproteobacteria bacterium]|nr:MAG: ABC transporter ATP-binding protein [Gammaproteobacteria bacterium]